MARIFHRKKLIIFAWLCCCSLFFCAKAEDVTDITQDYDFSVRSYRFDLSKAFDLNPETLWASASKGTQILQFIKPAGAATLSILWGRMSDKEVSLEVLEGKLWMPIAVYQADASRPETLHLPEEACTLRLVCNGELSIAEMRVQSGWGDNIFESTERAPSILLATPAPSPTPRPLMRGMEGRAVRELQERLRELGFNVVSKDSIFARNTYIAVSDFQRLNRLPVTGVVDYETYVALFSDAAVRATPTPAPFDPENPMARTASEFVRFVRSRLGCGYIYGGCGEISTPWFRKQRADLYPEFADLIMNAGAKWDGVEVYDCNGLIKTFLARSEGEYPPEWRTNVTGAVKRWMVEIEPIETMPREPGLLLLQKDPETNAFVHIGVYAGNGICVHARGHLYGVVKDPMPQLWTHWARPSWLTFDLPAEDASEPWPEYLSEGARALVDTSTGYALTMYTTTRVASRYLMRYRIPNKTEITIAEVPEGAHFWRKVTVVDNNGEEITGYVYAKDLTALELDDDVVW